MLVAISGAGVDLPRPSPKEKLERPRLATSGPAAAAASAAWAEYGDKNPITSSTSTWRCASTMTLVTNVGAQVCAVRSQSGISVQGAVIVRNNRGLTYSVAAETGLFGISNLGK
ncbi:hypothetical protein P8605_01530 [Streptomyces sp. T-3]|nr:hypothetical protein [Streptomyces sp. T-3]